MKHLLLHAYIQIQVYTFKGISVQTSPPSKKSNSKNYSLCSEWQIVGFFCCLFVCLQDKYGSSINYKKWFLKSGQRHLLSNQNVPFPTFLPNKDSDEHNIKEIFPIFENSFCCTEQRTIICENAKSGMRVKQSVDLLKER